MSTRRRLSSRILCAGVAALIGLAADADSLWSDLRVGELKTLLALAIGDQQALREGCDLHQRLLAAYGKLRQ